MITNKVIVDEASSLVSTTYKYDTINRLTSETRTAGVSPASSIEYAYDLAGNRTTVIDNGTTNTYTLGTGNRLSGVDATSPSRSLSFGYDVAGNTTNIVTGTNSLTLS